MSALTTSSITSGTPYLTAVGCVNKITITFQAQDSTPASPPPVSFCQPQSTGICLSKGTGGGDDWIRGADIARVCCSMHPKDRDKAASDLLGRSANNQVSCAGYGSDGTYDIYSCSQLSTTTNVLPNNVSQTQATFTFIPPYYSDLVNSGATSICFQVLDAQQVARVPYCFQIQLQRCSVCLETSTPGQQALNSLVAVAKSYGTHWSQLYSSNPDILGNPGKLLAGTLLRLGPLYQVLSGDTLISIALKFGVSVNQLLFWNKHLTSQADSNPTSSNHMSRVIKPGDVLCVLPKTCYNSFGPNQPVFLLGESFPEGQGGSWLDPLQVEAASAPSISA